MEYDNDRLRRRTTQTETVYLVLIALLGPVTDSLAALHLNVAGCIVAFLVSGITFPLYLLFIYLLGTPIFIRGRKVYPALLFGIFLLAISLLILTFYSFLHHPDQKPAFANYVSLSTYTIYRVFGWVTLNLSLSLLTFNIGRSIDQNEELQTAKKESTFFQLRYLRAQLNPHFLFNTLNSIYSLSLQKSDRAPEVVVRLADIMRYLIYECDEESILLDKEIEFIRNYIEIEKIRHQADIRLTVEGSTTGVRIEPFLFISFIENSFKHAMDNSFSEPYIYITIKVGNGQLTLNVINSMDADLGLQAKRINGKGIAHSRSLLELLYPSSFDLDIIQTQKHESRSSRVRLRNARERLETLYPDSHTLDVILNKSSFTVSLILKTVNAC
ncbi:MAG TPA: histidine kinase [Puia sp.]|jgi:sensor histidine kinase YesM|nr:histidine kinase [Puia sp.]